MENIPVLAGGSMLGHVDEFRSNPLHLLLRTWRELGPFSRFRLLNRWVVVVHDPEAIHEVLVAKAKEFNKSYGVRVLLRPVLGEGLISSEGAFWRRQRKLLAPIFTKERVGYYAHCMADCAHRGADGWKDGEELDVGDETMRITLSIVSKSLLGVESWDEAERIGRAMDDAQRSLIEMMSSVPIPTWVPTARNRRLTRALEVLDDKIHSIIAERRSTGEERRDVLTMLLRARDDEDGTGMTDEQVRDEAMTMYLAGHETTASALAWTVHDLVRHPDLYARHREEVRVLGGERLHAEHVEALPLTERIIKEAMRLHPPAYLFGREPVDEVEIGGHTIKPGTTVFMSPYVQHRRADLFPDPERVDPDRFTEAAEAKRPRYHYFPFGGGPAHLHRPALRAHGGGAGAGDDHPARDVRGGAGSRGRGRAADHASPQEPAAQGARRRLIRFTCSSARRRARGAAPGLVL